MVANLTCGLERNFGLYMLTLFVNWTILITRENSVQLWNGLAYLKEWENLLQIVFIEIARDRWELKKKDFGQKIFFFLHFKQRKQRQWIALMS